MMNIRDAANQTGLPAKTIRYYEGIDLINCARDANGYRIFDDNDIHRLAFIARARALGFTIEDCRNLLSLYEDTDRAHSDVREIARQHLKMIEEKIAALEGMSSTLRSLVSACSGNDRPECPILEDLSGISKSAHSRANAAAKASA